MTFKELKILKTDTATVFKSYEDERKFRIDRHEAGFVLYATKRNSRYFHPVKFFESLENAKKFIYTDEAWELMPENKGR